jgi:ribosomal protein S18 acetylase RimI-like enzyme
MQAFFSSPGGSVSGMGKVLQKKSPMQLRPGIEAFPVNLQHKAGGMPLPRDVQAKMEQALGANFADVRIHVGSEASAIGAIAFTWGANIHFAPGQYNPHTPQGQFLLGHELTHVVQQRAGRVSNPFGSGVAVVQDHSLEAEADRMGRLASSFTLKPAATNQTTAPSATPATGAVITRKPAPPSGYTLRPATRQGNSWRIEAVAAGHSGSAGSVRITPGQNGMFISDLSVSGEHRRHGVARQLVQAAMRTARIQGFTTAQLEARPSPGSDLSSGALVNMYQRLGFRLTGTSGRGNPLLERAT